MNFADKTKKDRDRLEEMRREASDRAWEEAFMRATEDDTEEWRHEIGKAMTMEFTTTGRELAEIGAQIMHEMGTSLRDNGVPEVFIGIQHETVSCAFSALLDILTEEKKEKKHGTD